MIPGILGKKIRQSRIYTESGEQIPVTYIQAGPCTITEIKTADRDGYIAIQLGFGAKKVKNTNKPELGHFKKAGLEKNPPRFLHEVRLDETDDALKTGQTVSISDVVAVGDLVRVTGISKGKGFAGVVKRHGFHGGPRTHGQSDRERAPGSVGQGTTPGRVYRGKRMAGRMGNDTVTVENLKVVAIDSNTHTVAVKGLIPGAINGLVVIRKA